MITTHQNLFATADVSKERIQIHLVSEANLVKRPKGAEHTVLVKRALKRADSSKIL